MRCRALARAKLGRQRWPWGQQMMMLPNPIMLVNYSHIRNTNLACFYLIICFRLDLRVIYCHQSWRRCPLSSPSLVAVRLTFPPWKVWFLPTRSLRTWWAFIWAMPRRWGAWTQRGVPRCIPWPALSGGGDVCCLLSIFDRVCSVLFTARSWKKDLFLQIF